MRPFLPIALFISSCSAISQQQIEADILKTAAAAGEGFLVGGKAGAIAYGTRQEIKNLHALSAKQPKKVTP
jgi:hypothetical protein